MPLGRYFLFTTSVLLALLFAADGWLPQPAAMPARSDVDRSIIRIQTRHKWPERIVIDTSLPTIAPPVAVAEAETPALPRRSDPEGVSQLSSQSRTPRDALAMATVQPEAAPRPAARKRVQTRRTRPARMVAETPFGYETGGFRIAAPSNW